MGQAVVAAASKVGGVVAKGAAAAGKGMVAAGQGAGFFEKMLSQGGKTAPLTAAEASSLVEAAMGMEPGQMATVTNAGKVLVEPGKLSALEKGKAPMWDKIGRGLDTVADLTLSSTIRGGMKGGRKDEAQPAQVFQRPPARRAPMDTMAILEQVLRGA